jgi:hypothetical protein
MDKRLKLVVVVLFGAAVAMWAYFKFYGFHWG